MPDFISAILEDAPTPSLHRELGEGLLKRAGEQAWEHALVKATRRNSRAATIEKRAFGEALKTVGTIAKNIVKTHPAALIGGAAGFGHGVSGEHGSIGRGLLHGAGGAALGAVGQKHIGGFVLNVGKQWPMNSGARGAWDATKQVAQQGYNNFKNTYSVG